MRNLVFILTAIVWIVLLGTSSWAYDRLPTIYWTNEDSDFNLEVYITAQDSITGDYSQVQIGTDDFHPGQFTNAHNAFGFTSNGQPVVILIEATSQDLECWQGPNLLDISGIWALVDDDSTYDFDYADAMSSYAGIHGIAIELNAETTDYFFSIFPNDAGAFVQYGATSLTFPDSDFSVTFGTSLGSWVNSIVVNGQFALQHSYSGNLTVGLQTPVGADPKIITDSDGIIWTFENDTPSLQACQSNDINSLILCDDVIFNTINETILTVTGTSAALIDFDVVWNHRDNSLHVVALEYYADGLDQTYELNYYTLRTGAWSDATIIDTWIAAGGDKALQDAQGFPQIFVDGNNGLGIYYVEIVGSEGDLRKWELPSGDYDTFDTPADWDQTVDVDDSDFDIKGNVTIGNQPV